MTTMNQPQTTPTLTRSKARRFGLSAAALTIALAGCGGGSSGGSTSADPASSSSAGSAAGSAGATSNDANGAAWPRDYEGTTIQFIGEATLNTQILAELVPQFTDLTGIDVQIEEAPYDSLVQKTTLDATTSGGAYDVISLPYEYLGAYAEKEWILPQEEFLNSADLPGFETGDIIPALWEASSTWGDHTYGAPSNSAVMMMFYRKDLYENADEQAAFSAAYGYDLDVPKTWDQYHDQAEFFKRSAGDDLAGEKLSQDFAGVATTGKRHVATVLEWLDYAWTYGGGIFDDSGNLIVNSTESVESLDYWKSLTPFAQPGYTSATWDETTATLQQGLAALSITWGDTAGAMEDPEASMVQGKMGYASIPVLKEGDSPLAHLGSWTYTVSKDTDNEGAAQLFIAWALSHDVQLELGAKGGLPATTSAFEDPDLLSTLPYWQQELTSLSEARSRPRIPEWGGISDALQTSVSNALSDQQSSKDALDAANEAITELMGNNLPVTQM